jgi:hypothetical protein
MDCRGGRFGPSEAPAAVIEKAMMPEKSRFAMNARCLIAVVAAVAGLFASRGWAAVEVQVSVDDRIELMSIIFYLAGNPEYGRPGVESYAKDVEQHFGGFRDHEAIRMARRLRSTRGVSYDAPMSLAVHLADVQSLALRLPLEPWPAGLDARWKPDEVEQFLVAGRRFAEASRFEDFFAAHGDVYAGACERMRQTLVDHARLEWFDQFFGQRSGATFHLVIGMLNGPSNYASRLVGDEAEHLYCILGVWRTDARGEAVFGRAVMPTVIHEFCHSYANPLVDAHMEELKEAGEKLYRWRKPLMDAQAYRAGSTVLRESLVRACVVRYRYAAEGAPAGIAEVLEQQQRGFSSVIPLSALLAEYEQQREEHPTLESFMPRIVALLNEQANSVPPQRQE